METPRTPATPATSATPRDDGDPPPPAELDTAALARLDRLGGAQFVARLIGIFLEESPRKLAAARTALDARDGAALAYAAHSLISSAANLGAAALSARARTVEHAAEAGRWERLGEGVAALEGDYARLHPLFASEQARWQQR